MTHRRTTPGRLGQDSKGIHEPMSHNVSQTTRQKRRAHKKSRAGCANCKLRRVKCDETQPSCSKCVAYGIECDYVPTSTGLHFTGETSFVVQKPSLPVKALIAPLHSLSIRSGPMPSLRGLETQFTPHTAMAADLDLLSKFQKRTVLTVGTKSSAKIYQNEVFKLALQYPFLTHVVLTLTLLHDHHLSGITSLGSRATLHWLEGTSQFQRALVKPGAQSQKDALWACAAMLGCIQFACIEARTPDEAWPLKVPSSDDLSWLKMSDGKKAVWKICDPSKPESLFNNLRGHPDPYRPFKFDGHTLSHVTQEFCELFGLDLLSDDDSNPYHSAAMCLASLLPQQCNGDTILWFLAFITQINPKLKTLLTEKEPKALLLVACWYAKIYRYQWWIHRRGLLEGQAICIYLDRHYGHVKSIQNLLSFPKLAFGLTFSGDEADQLEALMPVRSTIIAG